MRTGSQPTAVVIRQAQSPRTELTTEEPVLFDEVGDRLALPAVQPAGQHAQRHLQRHGVDHEPELRSQRSEHDVGRVVEHYGLDEILANLLSNASDYTPRGGRVELAGTSKAADVVIS
jgi:signal transduction histidine kinase